MHYLSALGGARKFAQSATLALAAKRWPWRILFFLLLSSCHVLGGRDLCAGSRQGSAGPTVEHVGSLWCTPCLWLKAYTATQPCLLGGCFPLLSSCRESSGASHITQQRCAWRFVEHSQRRVRLQLFSSCFVPSGRLIDCSIIAREVTGCGNLSRNSDIRPSSLRFKD